MNKRIRNTLVALSLLAAVAVVAWLAITWRLQSTQRADCENAGGAYVPLTAPKMLCLEPDGVKWQVH